jgi:hypothetical protein
VSLWARSLACTLFVAGLAGCVGTETGNPPATDPLADTAVGAVPRTDYDVPAGVDVDALARADELASTWLSLRRVELLPAGTCDALVGEESADVAGAIEVELPTRGQLTAPAGTYCGVRLWPVLAEDVPELPALLRGHSLALRLENAAGAPYVVVQSDRTDPIVLWAGPGGFTLGLESQTLELLVDPAGALVQQQFWNEPTESDGSYRFIEADDADFLRAFEGSDGLLRLFVAPMAGGGAGGGGAGGGGAGGGAGGAVDAGPPTANPDVEIAASGTPP